MSTHDWFDVGSDLVGAVARLIMDAVAARDPSALRKVADVLPSQQLRSRVAMLEAQAKAEAALGAGDGR